MLFLALSTLAILIATLRSGGTTVSPGWSFALASGDAALAELIQNLLLFIPLGMALVWNGVRPLRAIAIGAGLSFTVEFIQQWLPGRDPSAGDILANTISTAIGAGLVLTAPRWLAVAPHRAAWQSLATALAAATVWLGTGALLRPNLPPPPYHDVRNPSLDQWGYYRGKVLSVTFLPEGVRATAIAPHRPPGRPSPIVAILDARETIVMLIAVVRADLALQYRLPAGALTLEQPDLRWHNALAHIAPGDTFTVQAWRGERGERGACLALDSTRRCGLGYTIGDGWTLIFYPEHWTGLVLGIINMLWVGGWTLGIGYWAAKGGDGRRGAAKGGVAVALAILGLALVPAITGLNGTPVAEWIGALGGIAVGYGAAARWGNGAY